MNNTPPLDTTQLHPQFTGRLVTAIDSDYEQLRTVVSGAINRKPALIILAKNVADVKQAIALAQSTGHELAIRSGGHSGAGHSSSEGGIVLDLRQMKAYDINVQDQTAWVESGLTAGEFTQAADTHDLTIGFGDTGSVGIGGITLGGGVGFLVRKFGLAIDNLLAAEVVTADGQVLQVDNSNHLDLFWAIRGGGGNFGVVTRFKFRLQPLKEVLGGMLFLPATPETLAGFMTAARQAPNELSTILNVMPAPPMPMIPAEFHGKLIMMAMMLYAGDPESGKLAIAPFRALDTPIADLVKPIRYSEMFHPDDGSYHPKAAAQTMFMKNLDPQIAKVIIDQLQASDATMRVVQLRELGGKMAEVPVQATAFAHRKNPIMVNVAAFYTTPEDKILRDEWVRNLAQQLNQGDNSAYVNFLGLGDESRITDAYPSETLSRLKKVKRQYDPQNFFRLNTNIEPA